MLNPLFSPEFRESLADKLRPTMSFISDLVTKIEQQTNEGRVICALCDVKNSHGPARREALHNLDRVVTELFPPVEGAPLPSEELNGKADVLEVSPIASLSGASAVYYCCGPEPTFIYAPFPMLNRTKK